MSGAITNTPGLGAAQEALRQAHEAGQIAEIPQIALGYAVAYPLGCGGHHQFYHSYPVDIPHQSGEEAKALEQDKKIRLWKNLWANNRQRNWPITPSVEKHSIR